MLQLKDENEASYFYVQGARCGAEDFGLLFMCPCA